MFLYMALTLSVLLVCISQYNCSYNFITGETNDIICNHSCIEC